MFQSALPPLKTDEILELQTCIQPLPSRGAQEQTYLVGIESVREGRWTTHCEGTAIVGTHPDQNGSIRQTSGPDLDQFTNNHTRTTTIARITGEDSDPYQLHPLTIYGCLQHALASVASDEQHNGGGDPKIGNTVGLKVVEVEEFKVCSAGEKTRGDWTVHATNRSATLADQVACVDVGLKDEAGAVASILRGLQVTMCEEETREAFDTDLPPPDPKARIPAFLRPLLG